MNITQQEELQKSKQRAFTIWQKRIDLVVFCWIFLFLGGCIVELFSQDFSNILTQIYRGELPELKILYAPMSENFWQFLTRSLLSEQIFDPLVANFGLLIGFSLVFCLSLLFYFCFLMAGKKIVYAGVVYWIIEEGKVKLINFLPVFIRDIFPYVFGCLTVVLFLLMPTILLGG
ncbi:MAG: hypothetical protein QNJ54_19585 [Prochloraceae cyanobacterium]|nr:hypothetical protein [Prochloraceae cyanobacterium]